MASILNATTSSGLVTSADNSGSLQLATNNGTTAVTITTGQNVGIGVTATTQKLWVNGNTCVPDDSVFGFHSNPSAGAISNYYSGSDASNYLRMFTGGSERMRIDSSGYAMVGVTSALNSSRFSVSQGGASNAMFVATAGAGNRAIGFINASTFVGDIVTSTSSVSYNTSSDYRLKENITPMTGALAKVTQLKPVTYTWKIDGSDGQGFIAHELQTVIPDAVVGEKDAVETYTDENGNEQTRIKPQGVDTSFLVATLTAAIQELKAELDATKAEVQALKGVA